MRLSVRVLTLVIPASLPPSRPRGVDVSDGTRRSESFLDTAFAQNVSLQTKRDSFHLNVDELGA